MGFSLVLSFFIKGSPAEENKHVDGADLIS